MNLVGLTIIRPVNCTFALLLVLFAHALNIGYLDLNLQALLAALSVFLITGGGNTINDFFDYELDLKSKPYRPIPSKLITRKEAFILSLLFFSFGIAISSFVNSNVFMIAIVATLVLSAYGYAGRYLGLSGDVLVSFLTALVFIVGAFVASDKISFQITLVATAAFAISLSREIVKDIEDYDGDKGVKLTLPQKTGKHNAAMVALFFLVVNLLVVYALLPFYLVGLIFLTSIPIMLLLFHKVVLNLKVPNTQSAKVSQRIIKLMMFLEFLFVFLDKLVINLTV